MKILDGLTPDQLFSGSWMYWHYFPDDCDYYYIVRLGWPESIGEKWTRKRYTDLCSRVVRVWDGHRQNKNYKRADQIRRLTERLRLEVKIKKI